MSRKRLPLSDIKRRLQQQPLAPARAAQSGEADEASLLQAALRGVRPLAPGNYAEIQQKKPKPIPRPRESATMADLQAPHSERRENWIPAAWLLEEPIQKPISEEASDLESALRNVIPIKTDRIFPETPKPQPNPIQHQRDEAAALAESIYAPTSLDLYLEGGDELNYLDNGVARSVLRDLRRGRWVVQDQLDLHGCNRDEAREQLAASMGRWKKQGLRCVRVVHGKGRGSPGREPVLKKLVAGWLMNYADVMAYCQARLPEGGAGALIVLLKATRPTALL